MGLNEVISIKYGWNTIPWNKIIIPGHLVQDLLHVKIHTSCKISKFCQDFRGTKMHMGKIFGIWIYFYLKRQGYIDITRTKSTWDHIMFVHKSYNEIIDEIIFISPKTGQKWILLFWGSSISLLLQIGYSSFQAS